MRQPGQKAAADGDRVGRTRSRADGDQRNGTTGRLIGPAAVHSVGDLRKLLRASRCVPSAHPGHISQEIPYNLTGMHPHQSATLGHIEARLVITAVEFEGRTVAEIAKTYAVSRCWIYELLARHLTEGAESAASLGGDQEPV